MRKIMWLGLILFGLLLLGSSALIHQGNAATANIYFSDQTAGKGTIIYADNQSFVNNLTSLAYIDDLATPRTLENLYQTSSVWRANLGTWINMSYPLSPMDSGGFNSTQFVFYISDLTPVTFVSATFKFDITLLNNNTRFNRIVTFTTAGKKTILTGLEVCKACSRYTCTAYTTIATGGLRIRINQSRWGVIAQYDKTYYVRNAGFSLYENFGIAGKQVSINDNIQFDESSTFDYDIFNIAGQNNISFKNCSIYVNDRSNLFSKSQYIISDGKNLNFTNTYFYSSRPNNINVFFNSNLNITSSVFYGISIFGGRFVNVNDTIFTDYGSTLGSYYFKVFTSSAFKDVTFKNSRYGFYGFSAAIGNWNASDLMFKNIQYIMYPSSATDKIYLINCTSNSWLIDDSAAAQFIGAGKLVRSYTLELQVMNGTIPLSSANVKIYDKASVLRYSGSTDANGRIPKQVLDYCIWNETYPVTPYVYSLYRINLTKTGYRSVDYTFNNSMKRNMTVGMVRNLTVPSCNSTALSLYDDIVNASGTHQSSYDPVTGWRVWANYTGDTTPVFLFQNFVNATGTHVKQLRLPGWYVWANVTGNASTAPGTGNNTVMLNFTGLDGYIDWTGDYTVNSTNISFLVTTNMSLNGSVHVNEDAYFLSGMLSLDPAATILSLFFGFFYIGYKSDKRSGGWFMLFSGFLLIGLGVLIYGILGYAAVLVTPFAIFIMILGIKKGLYGPETTEKEKNTVTK